VRNPPIASRPLGATGSEGRCNSPLHNRQFNSQSDRNDLEVLLETFHSSIQLQAHCRTVDANARRYLTLEVEGVDQTRRLSHEIAKPVQSADTFFELSYLENFLDSRYFIHANRKKTPQNGYLHTSISVNPKKTSCLGV
jgi:hypothetical protein